MSLIDTDLSVWDIEVDWNETEKILYEEFGCDEFNGGCFAFAAAVIKAIGVGELYCITSFGDFIKKCRKTPSFRWGSTSTPVFARRIKPS